MGFIIKTARTLRNHWKKSTFAAAVITYGFVSGKTYFDNQSLMRSYCLKAAKYGKETMPVHTNPRSITVILNPSANKRKSLEEFEKYCAPLLHLAGISVEVVKTESEGHAKTLMENIGGTDAIVVAGGDGTLSEVITGLLRRTNENTANLVPLAILPLGKNNTVAKNLFSVEDKNNVRFLADATMAVIEEMTKLLDVMKIEVLEEDENTSTKPIYAVASLKWGAYRDAEAKKDSYWYFGALRKYATYIFNGYKSSLSWNCQALLNYSQPCEGCSNCRSKPVIVQKTGWFQRLVKENRSQDKYSGIYNPECQTTHQKEITTADLSLLTPNVISNRSSSRDIPKLEVQIGPDKLDYIDFVKNGWMSENGKNREVREVIEARTIEVNPVKEKESWFSIDNEYYEAKPIKITLLPELVNMYCKKHTSV